MGTRQNPSRIIRAILEYLNFERPEPPPELPPRPTGFLSIKLVWFLLGLVLAAWMLRSEGLGSMPPQARAMLAVAAPMALWWITEAMPISITALVPLVALPWLGISSARETAAPYADPNVFLFIGGFVLASCVQRWGLHKRLALWILLSLGSSPRRLVLGCMGVTALLSMWASNTATVLMMFPIALALVDRGGSDSEEAKHAFTLCLLLGIAYGGSLGGVATLIGTPPNIVFASLVRRLDVGLGEVTFLTWMYVGVPVSLAMLALIYLLLTRVLFRFEESAFVTDTAQLEKDLADLGPISRGETYIAILFSITALLWITRGDIELGSFVIPGWSNLFAHGRAIHDGTVAILMAILLFVVPVDRRAGVFLMDRDWYKAVPWDIVMLFGGGFALAQGFGSSGLSAYLGEQLGFLANLPTLGMMIAVALFMTFITELTSNTATTTVMLPILAATATATGTSAELLMLPATFAASAAFMLPVATPPNAIIFASGRISIPEMARAGFLLNIISAPVIALLCWLLGPLVFG